MKIFFYNKANRSGSHTRAAEQNRTTSMSKEKFLMKNSISRRSFLKAVGASKRANKERLAAYVKAETGLVIDPNTVFDVQVKRFHAYKRQLMNIMKVMISLASMLISLRQSVISLDMN